MDFDSFETSLPAICSCTLNSNGDQDVQQYFQPSYGESPDTQTMIRSTHDLTRTRRLDSSDSEESCNTGSRKTTRVTVGRLEQYSDKESVEDVGGDSPKRSTKCGRARGKVTSTMKENIDVVAGPSRATEPLEQGTDEESLGNVQYESTKKRDSR